MHVNRSHTITADEGALLDRSLHRPIQVHHKIANVTVELKREQDRLRRRGHFLHGQRGQNKAEGTWKVRKWHLRRYAEGSNPHGTRHSEK